MSYDIDNEAYSFVGDHRKYIDDWRFIASSKDKLYLFEAVKIFEMNKQYEVLDTVDSQEIRMCSQRYTNTEGIIFML